MTSLKSPVEFDSDSLFSVPEKLTISETSLYSQEQVIVCINNEDLEFPADWLRLRCQCKGCFNPTTLSHTSKLETLIYGSTAIRSARPVQDGKVMECVWEDGHICNFTSEWLYIRRFTKEGFTDRSSTLFFPKAEQWPESMTIQKATYEQVTSTDSGFEFFGRTLIRDGVFIITGTPDRMVGQEFCNEIGAIMDETHYGKHFAILNEPTPNNLSNTAVKLELHVDQPFLANTPNIQFLHCLTPAPEGGENVMADAIKAAKLLREREPQYYETLRDETIHYEDIIALPGQVHQYVFNRKRVINEDEAGEPQYLELNCSVMSSLFAGSSTQEWNKWITALKAFYKIYLGECSITIKTDAGDILVFDNQRVMHARESYSTIHKRALEGWYTTWDTILSRLRVAAIKRRRQGKDGGNEKMENLRIL